MHMLYDKLPDITMKKGYIMVEQKSIYINSFGRGRLLNDKGERILLRTKKAYELFFYFFHYREELVTKDDLVDILFPDMTSERGGSNLHTTIYQIRKEFDKHGYPDIIVYKSGTYFINAQIKSDCEEVQKILMDMLTEESLMRILKVYDGQYFERDNYEWSEYRRNDIHSKVILGVKEALSLNKLSNMVLMQFLLVFKEDCLCDLELLDSILDQFNQSRDRLKVKKIINDAQRYWEINMLCTLPEEISKKYQ